MTSSAVYWGLDPLFSSHIKLFIRDIFSLMTIKDFSNVYLYHGHVIYKVEIMGDVVGIINRNKFDDVIIDDGTARIACTLWKDRDFIKRCKLGDLVTVMGRVTEGYRDSGRKVVIQRLINDTLRPNIEHNRWNNIIQLNQQIYSPQGPIAVSLSLDNDVVISNHKTQPKDTVDAIDVQETIRKHLKDMERYSFTYNEMHAYLSQEYKENFQTQDIQIAFDKALKVMVISGELLMKDIDGTCFELINHKGELAQFILDIIKEKVNVDVQELCCLLRSTLTYAHLRKDTVIKALHYLEEHSFIYSPQLNVYKYVS